GALRLVLRELPEVIEEPLGRAAVVAGPEGGLRDGGAPALGHALVVVGGARHHVDVGVDVPHAPPLSFAPFGHTPIAPLTPAFSVGSGVGSLMISSARRARSGLPSVSTRRARSKTA